MESRDAVISKEIGQLLYDAAPDGANKIVMRAKLADEGDVGEFEFDYIDKSGETKWFTASGNTNSRLLKLLNEHRAFFVSQNQGFWKSCTFTVDVGKDRFSIDLNYD